MPVSSRRHRRSAWVPAALGLGALVSVLLLSACATRAPRGLVPVSPFDVDRYSGRWYEVARIEHFFEKGLVRTQAHYSRNPDGSLEVVNRGFHPQRKIWKQSVGKAHLTGRQDEGALKVSFFGLFYGGYHVVALDPQYQWALVVGSSLDYFWILSRTPTLPEQVKKDLMAQARALGVDEKKVVWVHQDGVNPTGM